MKEPKGLGGWLILVGIGVVLGPIMWFILFAGNGALLFMGETNFLTFFDFLASLGFLAYSGFLAFFFFKKKKQFPDWFMYGLLANFFYILLISVFTNDYYGMGSTTISTVIWVSYTIKSVRVKNTFIE